MTRWDIKEYTGQYDDAMLPRVVVRLGDEVAMWGRAEAEHAEPDARELHAFQRRLREVGLDMDYIQFREVEEDAEGVYWGWEIWQVIQAE